MAEPAVTGPQQSPAEGTRPALVGGLSARMDGAVMEYTKAQSRTEFRRWSSSYDESVLQRLLFMPSHDCILAQLGESAEVHLLDVGCGTGVFLKRVCDLYPSSDVWGLDSCREMIERGRQASEDAACRINWIQGDSEKLPFTNGRFDIVTCANSFHHYPDQLAAVAEMHRVLRPGGRLLVLDGYRDRLWGRFIYDVCVGAVEGAVHHASARRFRELFTQAGFVGVRQEAKLGLAPFLLTVGIAQKAEPVAELTGRAAA